MLWTTVSRTRFSVQQLERPIVQAPMGGGPSTPALAAAVSEAGGLGFLAAGYKAPEAVRADVEALRELTGRPFGVNVFAAPGPPADSVAVAAYAAALEAQAERYGVPVGAPRHDDDGLDAKLALLAELGVPVVSFTFGCPGTAVASRLHDAGVALWMTVTTPAEARQAEGAGADALVVQGVEAGGHRGSFDDAAPGEIGLIALLQLVRAVSGLPLVATGGLATGRAVAAVLALGASAAQLGTAFMLCPEAATAPAHRGAIEGDGETALTRAFTGRLARGVANRWMAEHGAGAPSAYPDVHHLTAGIRAAAREQGDPDGFHLWAGQAHALAMPVPAGELVRRLAAEAQAVLHGLSQMQEGRGEGRTPAP
ncbi:MAG TPA: nitronate monooxygenase [Solirubrobacteraceae bacterium]|jgi:nitronate monooxygenase|nr:nitronate monooxygenase [Solirubrobacteraceae bacterium]